MHLVRVIRIYEELCVFSKYLAGLTYSSGISAGPFSPHDLREFCLKFAVSQKV